MKEYIEREAALAFQNEVEPCICMNKKTGEMFSATKDTDLVQFINSLPAADVVEIPATGIGDLSDGFHTFNGLYYQRMILFAALVKQNKGRAWKSYRHEDGEQCFGGEWFIVGIDTPEGSYTYHYENKDFDLFDCVELPVAKHWDGHTEKDVTRLLSLPAADVREVVLCRDCKSCNTSLAVGGWYGSCRYWNTHSVMADDWCSRFRHKDSEDNCGAEMRGEAE